MKKILLSTLLIGSIFPLSASAEMTEEKVVTIVKDTLVKNPEIIKTALVEQRKKEESVIISKQNGIIQENKDILYKNPLDLRIGNANGDVKVTILHDFRCGHCKKAHIMIKSFLEEEKNVSVTFKDFPILGPDSKFAAKAVLAANKQDAGKQVEFAHKLAETNEAVSDDDVIRIATECKLDIERLKKDMDAKDILKCLGDTKGLAKKLEISGTPTYIIGKEGKEKVIVGIAEKAELMEAVAEARKA